MQKFLAASVLALTAAMAPAFADELVIGSELPLTGALARVGSGMNEGIQVAADVFNRTNGKHTVKVLTVDDESQPAKAVAAVEKLDASGAVAFTGGYGSSIIGPASDAAERLNKVYITSGGVSMELPKRGLRNFFRINSSTGYATALQHYFDEQGIQSVSVIYSTKEATEEVAKIIQESWEAEGKTVTMHPFDPSVTDFKPIVHKIKLQDRPDAIAMIGYENDYIGILRAAKVLKPDVKAISGVWSLATPKMWEEFPDLMKGVYGTSTLSFPAEFKTPEEQEFAETYKRLFNKDPDYLGIFGYVQSMLLFDAAAKAADAGTLDKGGVAEELRKAEVPTLIGTVKFNENGDNINFSHRMAQHQDGKIVLVWPPEAATGQAIFPQVPW